jgi:2-keto-4-pentenoate hydratase
MVPRRRISLQLIFKDFLMDRHAETASLMLSAWRDPSQKLNMLPTVLVPVDEEHAYAVQHRISAGLGTIGGWKVGSPGPDGPCNCAPLPLTGVMPSPARMPANHYTLRGVEAEISFRIGADLQPRDEPYARAEIIAAIACCLPAIEVLESRFTHPDALDKLTLLADSLSHGAYVYGPPAADWQGIDFASEVVELVVNGKLIKTATANPAGDMIRLIQWLADTGARWAGGLRAGQYVTCGSWTGKDFVPAGAQVQVSFAHAGSVSVEFGG